jgi:hypothetical protein
MRGQHPGDASAHVQVALRSALRAFAPRDPTAPAATVRNELSTDSHPRWTNNRGPVTALAVSGTIAATLIDSDIKPAPRRKLVWHRIVTT